ncbi:MAG: cytochrome b5 domain-containing protein [Caldilineaceae bacterium]
MVPARQVLLEATATNQRLGHENLGFLSETHGFIPQTPPLLALPPAYQLWDETAALLPELAHSLRLRQYVATMPVLAADEATLPDPYLLRASVILCNLAQTYHYIEPEVPTVLPPAILEPWTMVTRRLARFEPHASLIDMCIYNWQLLDPHCADPMRIENMQPLVSVWGSAAERIFLGSVVEIVAQSTPAIMAILRAQEAVAQDDVEAFLTELVAIGDCLEKLTYTSLPKLSLNAHSDWYVAPVVWSKTLASFSVPIKKGVAGPVGAATPSLQILDAFFERNRFQSGIGKETKLVRDWYPQHWRDFYQAIEQISASAYVKAKDNRTLTGLFQDVLHAYAGETGFLGRHQLKVYGFLETAFKVGRSSTVAFAGTFKDRVWDRVDEQLELARLERYERFPQQYCHYGVVKAVQAVTPNGQMKQIVFDLRNSGLRYQAGDRCAILPENRDELVKKTLQSLGAQGDECIQLDERWCKALQMRDGYQAVKTLPLHLLLKFGQIRPVRPATAASLQRILPSPTLSQLLQNQTTEAWELWELLDALAAEGADLRRLWTVVQGSAAQPEASLLCQVVPPEQFRMYSISSVMQTPTAESADDLSLTVSLLDYPSQQGGQPTARKGTASHFLASQPVGKVALKIVHPPRFGLPPDPTRPIVMIAGGAGFSPFRSFLLERIRQANAGRNWLFYSTRTRADFPYEQELAAWVAAGQLNVQVAFTREDVVIGPMDSKRADHFVFAPGKRCRIDDLLQQEPTAHTLWRLLRSPEEGGEGAYLYVCGRADFANSVMAAIKAICQRFVAEAAADKAEAAQRFLRRLIAEDRYLQDIFTTYRRIPGETPNSYPISEIVEHTCNETGYWMILNGRVYDMTEFIHYHPGGFKLLRGYAGMDATLAYQKVRHHVNPEIDSMLEMYQIGVVQALQLGSPALDRLYRQWVSYLFVIIEMENALALEFSLQDEAMTYVETSHVQTLSPVKLQLLTQAHERLTQQYLPQMTGSLLDELWRQTCHVCGGEPEWMAAQIALLQQSSNAQWIGIRSVQLREALYASVRNSPTYTERVPANLDNAYATIERWDRECMRELRLAVRRVIQVFEQFEAETTAQGGPLLLDTARSIPAVLANIYHRGGMYEHEFAAYTL